MNKERIYIIIAIIFWFISALIICYSSYNFGYKKGNANIKIDTCVSVTYRPKIYHDPEIKYSSVIGKIPIIISSKDTVTINDTTYVYLDREQKVYSDDSTYTAYVSGIQPSLDSISINQKIITNTIYITKELPKNSISASISPGYTNHFIMPISVKYERDVGWFVPWGSVGYDPINNTPDIRIGADFKLRF